MKLILQPDDGIAPILTAIDKAKRTIDILIFRLDRRTWRVPSRLLWRVGVAVRALTAHTNRGGDRHLRKLELHLLDRGVTVSRTADDLVRYHGKMMIVDGRILHVYGFNFTSVDIYTSRSFGIVTRNAGLVKEASRLFAADFDRRPYTPCKSRLVVSPENSRDRLATFLRGTRRQLLIYDSGLTDDAMLRIIEEKIAEGVDVKILGKVEAKWHIPFEKYPGRRLHVRMIVRDGQRAFVGSQSLRKLELDKRREVGVIVTDREVVNSMMAVFARDWAETPTGRKGENKSGAPTDGKEPGPEDRPLAAP